MPSTHRASWAVTTTVLILTLTSLAVIARSRPTAASHSPSPLEALHFRNLGPAVAGGRVTAVAGVPGNANVYYVGTAGGGVFRTEDGGVSWAPLFQHQAVSTIGALALAPSNPNFVWVGTGEANIRNDVVTGHGVYFSPDGGRNWHFMGLANAGQISSIVVSPLDPNTVFVGVLGDAWEPSTERGVFRSTDGGKTWKQILYVGSTTGVSDLVMEPDNPKVLYAGMWQVMRRPWILQSGGPLSGIYRSTDGGDHWQKLTEGLPSGPMGRIGLAVAPSDPARVYALIGSRQGVLWGSHDRGEHWSPLSHNRNLDARPFYFSHLVVSPDNPLRLYFLSFHLLESTDGGHTARTIGPGLHADQHALWIDPRNPKRMIEGNDGGVYLSTDGGHTWRHLDNIPIEQIYSVSIDNGRVPYGICIGLQDNGSWCGPSNSLSSTPITDAEWTSVGFGDGQYAVPAHGTPFIFSDSQNGEILRLDRITGETAYLRPYFPGVGDLPAAELKYRFNWTAPIAVSPDNPRKIYLGANVLFRSTDAGRQWKVISPDLTRNDKSKQQLSGGPVILDLSGSETYDTILSIGISKEDPNVIWVGTDDGVVQVTRDGGRRWTNVTANIPSLPPWGRISQIATSPFAAGTAYIAVDLHEMGNNHPYVFRTDDFGATWKNITANLPRNAPAHVVREDPNRRGLLVVGTDTGLFYSVSRGPWQPIHCGFPITPVYDLKFVKSTHDLVVGTHGRGIFVLDDIAPLEQVGANPPVGLTLFAPLAAVRWARFNRHGFQLTSFTAPNPSEGAAIDYYIRGRNVEHHNPVGGAQQVTITITDASGHPVRTLKGPGQPGYHRIHWDLRYDPPVPVYGAGETSGLGYDTPRGPMVVPGKYHVRLAAEGKSQSVTLQVEADPRTHASDGDFQAQEKAALEARELVSSVDREVNRIDALRQQLDTLEYILLTHEKNTTYQMLFELASQLNHKLDQVEEPIYDRSAVNDSKAYLHSLSRLHGRALRLLALLESGYAQRPTRAAREEMARLRREASEQQARLRDFVRKDLATFNRVAASAGVSQIFVPVAR